VAVRKSREWSVVQKNENENEKYYPSLPFVTGCLSDQDIPSEKSKALDSPTMLEHAKVV
jgi:hypothetical protein